MAIIVKEDIEGRTGEVSFDNSAFRIVYDYTRTMIVWETGTLKLGPKAVIDATLAHLGIRIGSPYFTDTESDTRAVLIRISPQQTDVNKYQVTLTYTSNLERTPAEIQENPFLRPPRITLGSRSYSVTKLFDVNNKPCQNSANFRFIPAPTANENNGTFSVEKNVPSINFQFMLDYVNTVNDASWAGFKRGEVKIVNFGVTGPHFENSYIFWTPKIDFEYKKEPGPKRIEGGTSTPEGWDSLILDVGYMKKGTFGKKLLDDDGRDIEEQVLLDGTGNRLTSPSATNSQYIKFQFYKHKDFSALGLGV